MPALETDPTQPSPGHSADAAAAGAAAWEPAPEPEPALGDRTNNGRTKEFADGARAYVRREKKARIGPGRAVEMVGAVVS